ncbi:MAG TPA: TIGR04076 family protein [Oscillospiraceae bacterium]|nr:TIGR04076 family protein [Oscillospiraceae bacterium]
MKKWYDEEYEWEIEVTGFLRGDRTEHYCRNGEEIGDKYTCTYGCPVNKDGQGICSKVMLIMFPIMEAVRSGGDLENIGGSGKYVKDVVCPDGCVMFRLTAKRLGNENFHKGKFFYQL